MSSNDDVTTALFLPSIQIKVKTGWTTSGLIITLMRVLLTIHIKMYRNGPYKKTVKLA